MREISIAHREPEDWTDRVALETVRMLRRGMDLVTGYKHPKDGNRALDDRYNMTGDKWMRRFIFLESVAGVPGMVGGMLRHLKSLRRMKGDNGWYASRLFSPYPEKGPANQEFVF